MLEAVFNETVNTVTVNGLTQWDYGRKLYIKGLDLPEAVEVHFCNVIYPEAKVMVAIKQGDHTVVDVPNMLLQNYHDIMAWVFVVGEDKGQTIKTIILKVQKRAKPEDFISVNPEAGELLEDAINKMNECIQDNKDFKEDMNEFSTDLSQRQDTFETTINQKQTTFETNITQQQTTFETNITQRQTNFETSIQSQQDQHVKDVNSLVDQRLSSVYRPCGSVATEADLPTDAKIGDVYDVLDSGVNYAWTGEKWDSLAGIIDLSNYYNKAEVDGKVDELKKSVSDGKTKLATSITNKKVPTNPTDSFDTMASNIDSIKLGSGNAQPNDVRSGKTFTNDSGVQQTGTLAVVGPHGVGQRIGVGNGTLYIHNIPEGIYEKNPSDPNAGNHPEVGVPSNLLGNAQASDVKKGKTFTSQNGVKIAGTMEELTDITHLFATKGDNTTIANTIFGTGKFSWYGGDNGGSTSYYASCSSNVARYVAFVTGSFHSGAGDGQGDGDYNVYYKTSASGSWVKATRQNGVWAINKNIFGIRVFCQVHSSSSMHRPSLSRHNIIGAELPADKLPDNLFGNVPQYLREQYNATQPLTLKASEGKTYLLHCINYWSSAPDGNELDIKSVTNATYYKIVTDEYQERPGGKWVYFSLYLIRLTGNSNAVVSYNSQDTDQQVSIIKVG